jgi:hypothetical protein
VVCTGFEPIAKSESERLGMPDIAWAVVEMKEFIVEGWLFIAALIVLLFLITYFPSLVLVVPRLIG